MPTTAEVEDAIDYTETARLANEAFEMPLGTIRAERLQWFYERCFSLGTTVIALKADGQKVGQIAMVRQSVMLGGVEETAAQLVDLFILRSHRGSANLRQLYGEVERQFHAQGIRFAIGMPNAKAIGVNAHFFKLEPFLRLPLNMGYALPLPGGGEVRSFAFDPADTAEAAAALAPFATPRNEDGLPWDAPRLIERLCGVKYRYAIHVGEDIVLISSPRVSKGLAHTLLCGFFVRHGAHPTRRDVAVAVRAATGFWGHRLFAYAGVNAALPAVPGFRLPAKLRPSPMLVQLRDFKPEKAPFHLDRFQLLDFDFA